MTNPVWPPSLPAYVLESGYQNEFADNVVETPMEVGPAKTRRRSTVENEKFNVSVQLTTAQFSDLKTFYYTTLKSGSLAFDWVDPLTQTAATFMFRRPAPKVTGVRGGVYPVVSFTLEKMP
jgi:hypothetical protein